MSSPIVFPRSIRSIIFCCCLGLSISALPVLYAQPERGDVIDTATEFSSIAEEYQEYSIVELPGINSKDLDYAPTLVADGSRLYFVSNRPDGVGGHDIWYTDVSNIRDREFSLPINLGVPVNTALNEGVAAISADGTTLFFTACNRTSGVGDCDIYTAKLVNTVWTDVKLVPNINSRDWDSQPSISASGDSLYFVSNRPGAIGGSSDIDIYLSVRDIEGNWNRPINLGSTINTAQREDSPFIVPGSNKLYFSSAGRGGFGRLDFFVAELQDGKWTEPENLGSSFNTPADERFITGLPDEDVLLFTSERTDLPNQGILDIFMGIRESSSVEVVEGEKENVRGKIAVVPNPVGDVLTLDFVGIEPIGGEAIIYSARGEELQRVVLVDGNEPIPVSKLSTGFYILRLGKRTTTFVIRR